MKKRLDASWNAIHLSDGMAEKTTKELTQTFSMEQRCVPNFLITQAMKYGSKVLFSCNDVHLTYEEAPQSASKWGAMLHSLGVEKGDRVVLLSGNCPQYMEIILGCAWIGAIAVPVNTASRGHQLHHILKNCGAKICFVEDLHFEMLLTIDTQTLPLKDVFVIGDHNKVLLENLNVSPIPHCNESTDAAALGPEDPLAILYTSGTTGMSKGVLCPHGQFFWWSVLTARQLGIGEEDVLHTTLPLFHVNALGCFFQALLYGATQVVSKRFSVTRFWDELIESQATVTYLLGAMVPMLLSKDVRPEESTHNVRVALAPGVPNNFHTPFMERSAIVLLDGYGSTETNAVIGCNAQNYKTDTMGTLKDGIEACVVDAFDQPVPDGSPGELLLRSSEPFSFASGYFNTPEKTVEAWRNLWFHTGDNVVRSSDGYYKFIDRAKDCIRRRGENISSFEVEQVLASHPNISLVAVYGVPSDLGEDEVMASVVLNSGQPLDEEQIIRFCEGRMSYFSIPRFIEITHELPRTENGKIQKFKLREQGKTALTWDREIAGVIIKR